MPIKNKLASAALLASIIWLASCGTGEKMNTDGRLIYTAGGGSIDAINLGAFGPDIDLVYKGKKSGASIQQLTKINNGMFLFDECLGSGGCTIHQYDLHTNRSRMVRSGRLPSYVKNHDKLFFYDKSVDGKSWLFAAPLEDLHGAEKVAMEPEWRVLPNGVKQSIAFPPIQVSEDTVIYIGDEAELFLYNILSDEVISTKIGNCHPLQWLESHSRLLCADWNTWDPFLLDITNNNRIHLSELQGAYNFVYIPRIDTLIYGKRRSYFIIGEAHDIFSYSLSDRKEMRVKKDAHIASGIWVE